MKHRHYHKDVSHLKSIDIYRLLELFEVTCPVAQHIVKKALAAGKRGAKDQAKDMSEIADSANRWIEMREEDAAQEPVAENEFDEARVDRVASSHGDGEHYSESHITRCCHSRGCAACEPAPKGIQK